MPQVGLEPTIPALERAKTGHALDRAATVFGTLRIWYIVIQLSSKLESLTSLWKLRILTHQCPSISVSLHIDVTGAPVT
jgi:hypothetical protein